VSDHVVNYSTSPHSLWQDMVIHENSGSPSGSLEEGVPRPTITLLPQLDATACMAVVTHNVAAYSSCLEHSHLQRLSIRITSDTTRWLSHFFR
jgi:hypothetical protein